MPGDLLDLILIVLAAAFAVAGYRQGFIIGVLSFAGFLGGVAIGAVFAPKISQAIASSLPWQAFIAILVVFAAAVIGMVIASSLGVALRSRVRGRPATVVDSLGGALVNVAAVLLVAWLIGSFVAYSPFPAISSEVNNSFVLKTVDKLVPHERPDPARLPAAAQPAGQRAVHPGVQRARRGERADPPAARQRGAQLGRAWPARATASSRSWAWRRAARSRSRARASSSRPSTC